MSWSRALCAAALLLAGCGFAPAYGPGGSAAALRGMVAVSGGTEVFDYRLRSAIESRIGQGTGYDLVFAARVEEIQAAVTPDGTITRYNVTGIADWTLRDADGVEVAAGRASGFTSYLTTGSTVSTEAAQRDAQDRLAVVLADQIVARLMVVPGPQ